MKQDHLFAFVNPIKDMQVPLAILTKRGGTINESILPLNYHETKNARVNGKAATKAAAKAAKKAEGSKKPSSKRPKQPDAITSPNKKQKPGNDDAAITVVRLDTEKHDG